TPEALIIVEESRADDVLSRVGQLVTVTQRLPPRLAIVRGERADLDAVSRLPGVLVVAEGSLPESALRRLNETEQLFAEAWVLGRQPKASRPGEGLSWDAPGFQPPDGPKGHSDD
ncbi:hypothetical protein HMI51_20135, partial [Corallococcus coralloides]|nr:hypothetical protein [Corallococcus coralloides]